MNNRQWGEIYPPREEFLELGATRRVVPVAMKVLVDDASPVSLYRTLALSQPGTFMLESAERDGWSRWSFIGVAARAWMVTRDGVSRWYGDVPEGITREGSTLELLQSALDVLSSEPIVDLPPLTGGLVGTIGWDVLYEWNPELRREAVKEYQTPEAVLTLVDDLVAVDHKDNCVWLIANAINRNGTAAGIEEAWADALSRIEAMRQQLNTAQTIHPAVVDGDASGPKPQWRVTKEEFARAIEQTVHYINAGEATQVVIAQRADVECPADPVDVYRVLRSINPSPYMFYVVLPDDHEGSFTLVGSSPETLLRVKDRQVMTFPIGGTRPRPADPRQDAAVIADLQADPKEVHEHELLVELSEHDLGLICDPATIEVVDRRAIKVLSHVIHLTSTVTGTLREDVTIPQALQATFPAGTLSGAPKERAIEMIDELEPALRGIFGGVTGYFDFSGNTDLAITIRTAIITGNHAQVQAGAGVVAQSHADYEYNETQNKAGAVLKAIELAARLSGPAS
ncbi:chorismate-binding protein [Trueperella sp. LYQ141]|uniref:chorismate-binding protein n=1 Tax=Trueperella sp. LYQ141 TaxID=3391058 RepID=UPI0039832EDE